VWLLLLLGHIFHRSGLLPVRARELSGHWGGPRRI